MSTDRHSISPYPIRMAPELRDLLEKSAQAGSRSLHSDIIARLEMSFKSDEGSGSAFEAENNAMLRAICGQLGIKVES